MFVTVEAPTISHSARIWQVPDVTSWAPDNGANGARGPKIPYKHKAPYMVYRLWYRVCIYIYMYIYVHISIYIKVCEDKDPTVFFWNLPGGILRFVCSLGCRAVHLGGARLVVSSILGRVQFGACLDLLVEFIFSGICNR